MSFSLCCTIRKIQELRYTCSELFTLPPVHYFEGEIKGTISYEPRGTSGFGYDPLFIPTGYRSTFAELGPEIKNNISHRAIAVKKLIEFLEKYN